MTNNGQPAKIYGKGCLTAGANRNIGGCDANTGPKLVSKALLLDGLQFANIAGCPSFDFMQEALRPWGSDAFGVLRKDTVHFDWHTSHVETNDRGRQMLYALCGDKAVADLTNERSRYSEMAMDCPF